MTDTVLSGGCACGGVRYRATAEPDFSLNCQCRKCQRITGTGYACLFRLGVDDVSIEGEIRTFDQPSDSGSTTSSGFCPACGSPVFGSTERFPDVLYFHAATLDDPSRFRPEFVAFRDAAQPWDHVDPDIPVPEG
jgi:hypothetical protein